MSKYLEIQSRKMVGYFAGVGALVEDKNVVVEISPLDYWLFFKKEKYNGQNDHYDFIFHIKDKRLLERLNNSGFKQLKTLVKAPENSYKSYSNYSLEEYENTATAKYFPKWMFCSSCYRLKHLDKWYKKWQQVFNKTQSNFTPPKCGYCYEEAKNNKKGKQYHELTQVRFIMISSDGKISDVPWDKWLTFKQQSKHEEDKTIDFGNWQPCCDNQDLYYKLGDFEDLAGININCDRCKKRSNLVGLYNLTYFSDNEKKHRYKMVIRSSNSVYYPILVHSLYLPSGSSISDNIQARIDRLLDKDKNIGDIFDALDEQYSKNEIKNYIKSRDNQGYEKELNYRSKEYQFFIDNKEYQHDDFIFTHQTIEQLNEYGITHLVKIPRLKMTIVQTGYTRQQPLDIDSFLNNEAEKIKPKYTSTKANKTEYLLGIENFGEGIFIAFNDNIAQGYLENREKEIEKIFKKSKDSALFKGYFKDKQHLARFIIIHTLSHLLMKELEFSCGYPTVSLNERLFVDDKEMQGVLIYTVGGMEGSYGGLVSQAEPDKFKQLLKNAIERAEDCASDPICYHSEGQGVDEINLAACYSCALVAENACEVFNSFLDRQSLKEISQSKK